MKEQNAPLRRGYTTGVHAAAAFGAALEGLLASGETTQSRTRKMDNDDLDITKGCEIVVTCSYCREVLVCNPIAHTPYTIGKVELYAGEGVGVVTKAGLKPPKGYPAINPAPLKAMEARVAHHAHKITKRIYATVSVTDGQALAKKTANAKVGVLGGISILGSTGIVKPVSSDAYLDSIATEVGFAKENGYQKLVLTLGNSALAYAKTNYDEAQIIEIGNFVHDTLEIAQEKEMYDITFICGIAKAVKVMQGCKNTHNRFGSIDFEALCIQIKEDLNIEIAHHELNTVKGLTKELGAHADAFYHMVKARTDEQIKHWFPNLKVGTVIVR